MSKPTPPTIPSSGNFRAAQVENLSVGGKLFKIDNPRNNDVIAYQESLQSWVPLEMGPTIFQTTCGVIRNLNLGTQWIRWGVNTDGQADSFIIPQGSYVGFTFSFNDLFPINTGADPSSSWTVDIGLVYDGVETNIDCPNSEANFHPIDSVTFTKADIDATNGFPQFIKIPNRINLTGPSRISARSTSSGSINFGNGDIVINVYLIVNTLDYQLKRE